MAADEAIVESPFMLTPNQEKAIDACEAGDYREALQLLDSLSVEERRHPRMLFVLADSLYEIGDDLGALEICKVAGGADAMLIKLDARALIGHGATHTENNLIGEVVHLLHGLLFNCYAHGLELCGKAREFHRLFQTMDLVFESGFACEGRETNPERPVLPCGRGINPWNGWSAYARR